MKLYNKDGAETEAEKSQIPYMEADGWSKTPFEPEVVVDESSDDVKIVKKVAVDESSDDGKIVKKIFKKA